MRTPRSPHTNLIAPFESYFRGITAREGMARSVRVCSPMVLEESHSRHSLLVAQNTRGVRHSSARGIRVLCLSLTI